MPENHPILGQLIPGWRTLSALCPDGMGNPLIVNGVDIGFLVVLTAIVIDNQHLRRPEVYLESKRRRIGVTARERTDGVAGDRQEERINDRDKVGTERELNRFGIAVHFILEDQRQVDLVRYERHVLIGSRQPRSRIERNTHQVGGRSVETDAFTGVEVSVTITPRWRVIEQERVIACQGHIGARPFNVQISIHERVTIRYIPHADTTGDAVRDAQFICFRVGHAHVMEVAIVGSSRPRVAIVTLTAGEGQLVLAVSLLQSHVVPEVIRILWRGVQIHVIDAQTRSR